MFLNINVFRTSVLFFHLLFVSLTQTEPIIKGSKSNNNICKYGFPKYFSTRCDGKKVIKCENRCDFTEQCVDKSDEINCGQCDFTQNMCGWKDVDKNRLSWVRVDNNNEIECSNSGNETCVLSLLKVNSNKNITAKAGNRSRLRSPKLQASAAQFCAFNFEIKHNQKDCLLSVRLVNDNQWLREELNLKGHKDKNWTLESVGVGNVITSGYQIEFLVSCEEKIANRKPNKSFLEIKIKNMHWSDCDSNTNKSFDSKGFDCDFESNLCNKWSDLELNSDKFLHWKRSNNHQIFGNNIDNEPNQYFVYTEKYDRKNTSQIARLSSLEQKSTDIGLSLSFDYLITNTNYSALYLVIKETNLSGNGEKTRIWKSTTTKASQWQNACINITQNFTNYQLIFEAHFKALNKGVVAIKSITQSENEYCVDTKDNMSELNGSAMSTSVPSTDTKEISLTTLGLENADIYNVHNITKVSIESPTSIDFPNQESFGSNGDNENNLMTQSYAWILKGTAVLIIVLIFITIKFWKKKRRRDEELLPLTDSDDIIYNQSINSSNDDEL